MATFLVWLMRIFLGMVGLIVLLLLVAFSYQQIASWREERILPPPGQVLDVGGYRLHFYCVGKNQKGSPTVVLDSANLGTVSNWVWVQQAISSTTRACAYDRAGIGWSDLSPQPHDTRQNAQALEALLQKAKIAPPYVLVGHSFGGLFVRMYAELYPDKIAGMVLIEGTNPDALAALGKPDVMPNAPDPAMLDAAPFVSRFGLLRLMRAVSSDPDLPSQQRAETDAYYVSTRFAETIKRQYHLFPALLAQVREINAPGKFGNKPLAIILGSLGDGGEARWQPLFAEQEALSTNSATYVIEGATHASLVDKQADALQTAAIILKVVAAVIGKTQ